VTLGHCNICKGHTRQLGPYFMPIKHNDQKTLYAHYQCLNCGTVAPSFGMSPSGKVYASSWVQVP